MSALRKAGVWLGLVEDDDDPGYDEREPTTDRQLPRARDRAQRFEDYPDEEEPPAGSREAGPRDRPAARVPRPTGRDVDRGPERTDRRATVRSITREPTVSYLTRDNLALAPDLPAPPPATATDERRYQITTLHPTSYRDARTIGEHFRDGTPVIMNLTEMDEADARRLVDFGAGLAFGLRGSMERVTNRVFLLSPANVHVTAEDKAKIAEGEFLHHH
jgi:cell division inhibitor SepF